MRLTCTILLTLVPVFVTNCKSEKKSTPTAAKVNTSVSITDNASTAPVDQAFADSEKAIQAEPNLDVNTEYDSYKAAIAEYKKTTDYTKPKTPEDEAFNTMVDNADSFSKEDFKKFVDDGKFTEINNRINDLESIQKKANLIATTTFETDDCDSNDSTSHTGSAVATCTSSATETSSTTSTASSGSNNSLLRGTGIFFIVAGTLNILVSMLPDTEAKKTIDLRNKNLRNLIAGSGKINTAIALTQFGYKGLMLFMPLVVGSLLVSSDNPSDDTIRASQGVVGLMAAVPAIYTAIAIAALAGQNMTLKNRTFIAADGSKSAGSVDVKLAAKHFLGEYSKMKLTAIASFSMGVTIGLSVWANQLGLAEKPMSAKDKVTSKIARLPVAAIEIERRRKTKAATH